METLNNIREGLAPHEIKLKLNAIVMLLLLLPFVQCGLDEGTLISAAPRDTLLLPLSFCRFRGL